MKGDINMLNTFCLMGARPRVRCTYVPPPPESPYNLKLSSASRSTAFSPHLSLLIPCASSVELIYGDVSLCDYSRVFVCYAGECLARFDVLMSPCLICACLGLWNDSLTMALL